MTDSTREVMEETPSRSSRLPYIQGLRAVAVLAVIAFHAGLPLPGGFVGVDVFFVISGFVITEMLRREWLRSGTIRLRTFYRRRFQRLGPALALLVLVVVLLSALLLPPFGFQQRAALTGIGAELSVANFVITFTTGGYFDFLAEVNPLLHTWSLSVEEQFYLVFAPVILIALLLGRRLRWTALVPTILILGSAVSFLAAVVSSTGWTPRLGASLLGFYSPVTRAWEFGVGALVALASAWILRRRGSWLNGAAWAGLVGVAASFLLISERTPFPGVWTLLPVLSTALLIAGGLSEPSRVGRALSWRPVVRVGDASYSLYLWHWPFIVFALILWPGIWWVPLLAAVLSALPAVASYRWLEQPIRLTSRPSARWVAGLVALTLVPPIVAAGALYALANRGWGIPAVVEEQARGGSQGSGLPPDCMGFRTIKGLEQANLEACTFNSDAEGPPFYLLGDSNAGMYGQAIIAAGQALGRPVLVSTAADCPFIDGYRGSQWGAAADEACRAFYVDSIERLASAEPGTVVLASSIRYAFDPSYTITGPSGASESSVDGRVTALADGVGRAVETLQAQGNGVVLVTPTYRFEGWDTPVTLEQCPLIQIMSGQCPVSIPEGDIADWQQSMRSAVATVASESKAGLVDLGPYQCEDGTCSDAYGTTRVYDDPGHLTKDLTMLALPEFIAAISAADPRAE